ncbi:fatty acid desaturase [Leptothoe sp. ISB3NOV94-8A]|nr:fatty acid desaturase [Leptothoe sp. LEGE 181152]
MTVPNSAFSLPVQQRAFTTKELLKSLPQDCFLQQPLKAWTSVFVSVLAVALGTVGLFFAPWYLCPPLWIFTGTALTGFFILGHECGHYSFAKRKWVNECLGHLLMLPLLYPFHNWRIQHNTHHRFTNKLGGERWRQLQDVIHRRADIAWYPLRPEVWKSMSLKGRLTYQFWREWFWWLASIQNWWYELNLKRSTLSTEECSKVRLSSVLVYLFAVVALAWLYYLGGIWAMGKFWLLPWLVFHFWLSTFTRVHHSAVDIPWRVGEEWNNAEAQLYGTVHCRYPRWVEFLCHDINIHIPHHISTAIPHYHLRMAHTSLKRNWGEYMRESEFSWHLFWQMGKLNLYCPEQKCYLPLSD